MIDIFDILFFIALLLSIGCVCVSYKIHTEISYKGLVWLIGAFAILVVNRALTCLRGFDVVVFSNDVNSTIGVVTIGLLLAGMLSLLKAIQKYKHINGNGK